MEIITEANVFAQIENKEFVEKYHVKKAINEKHKRLNKIENKIDEFISNNKLHQNGRVVYKWAIQTLSYDL